MRTKKHDKLNLFHRLVLRFANSLLNLYNFIALLEKKRMYFFAQRETPKCFALTKQKDYSKKVDSESISAHIEGVDFITTKGLTSSHTPKFFDFFVIFFSISILKLAHLLSGNLTKQGYMNLKKINSDFYIFNSDEMWMTDKDFALRFVQGSLAPIIRKAKQDDAFVKEFLEQHTGNQNLVENLYLIDFTIFDNIATKKGYAVGAPQVLFTQQKDTKILTPLAIKILPNDKNIYTPNDSKEAWILAKLFVLSAELIYAPLVYHVINTHLWMDAVVIATESFLPKSHPIYLLLSPHLSGTVVINKLAFLILLKENAFFDDFSAFNYKQVHEIIAKAAKKFDFQERIFPIGVQKRQVEDIVYYPYRDDATLLWKAIHNYVTNFLHVFYAENIFHEDEQLKKWVTYLTKQLDIDKNITLSDILSAILFNVFDHNIQQNSFIESYMHPWQVPNGIFKSVPQNKAEIDEEYLFEAATSIRGLIAKGMLIQLIDKQYSTFKPFQSADATIRELNTNFADELSKIEQIIRDRNKTRVKPYTYAYPSLIDSSIKV